MDEVRARIEADPELRKRLDTLRVSDQRVRESYPTKDLIRAFEARRLRKSPREPKRNSGFALPRWRITLPAFAVLAAGLILMVRPGGQPDNAPDNGRMGIAHVTEAPATIRLKGSEAGLAIFRKTKSGSELLPPQSYGRPGDALQVFYHNKSSRYGMIFSVDGTGSITLHFPESGSQAGTLQIGAMLPLPHAFRLDNAPRMERFMLVTSQQPFPCDSILARVREAFQPGRNYPDSIPALDPGFRQYSYTIKKPEALEARQPKQVGK